MDCCPTFSATENIYWHWLKLQCELNCTFFSPGKPWLPSTLPLLQQVRQCPAGSSQHPGQGLAWCPKRSFYGSSRELLQMLIEMLLGKQRKWLQPVLTVAFRVVTHKFHLYLHINIYVFKPGCWLTVFRARDVLSLALWI